jgi:hypothetical protein
MAVEKLKSLPQPAKIVGMAGNVGFDPFGFPDELDVLFFKVVD